MRLTDWTAATNPAKILAGAGLSRIYQKWPDLPELELEPKFGTSLVKIPFLMPASRITDYSVTSLCSVINCCRKTAGNIMSAWNNILQTKCCFWNVVAEFCWIKCRLLCSQICRWAKPMECSPPCQPKRRTNSDNCIRVHGMSQCSYFSRWKSLFMGYDIFHTMFMVVVVLCRYWCVHASSRCWRYRMLSVIVVVGHRGNKKPIMAKFRELGMSFRFHSMGPSTIPCEIPAVTGYLMRICEISW